MAAPIRSESFAEDLENLAALCDLFLPSPPPKPQSRTTQIFQEVQQNQPPREVRTWWGVVKNLLLCSGDLDATEEATNLRFLESLMDR